MLDDSKSEVAGVILGGRACFYYPPGAVKGWTLKRLVAASMAGFLFWSLVLLAVERLF